MAYFLLTGTPVFDGATPMVVCTKHTTDPPEPPSQRLSRSIGADLEAAVLCCLEKKPACRPAGALAFREALDRCEDAGRWSQRDADEWWEEYQETVDKLRAEACDSVRSSGDTLAVDIRNR